MSIQSEIDRISGNVSDALDAVAAKGVTVPSGANSDNLPDLISAIPTPSAGSNTPQPDSGNGSAGSSNNYSREDHVHPVTAALGSEIINALTTGTDAPKDDDYFVSQYVNGGTATTTYHRRKFSALWTYIKGKIESVLPSSSTPSAIATSGSAGSSTDYARADHTHASGISSGEGYIKFPNGSMICWGLTPNWNTVAANSYADVAITFPQTFNAAPVVMLALYSDSTGTDIGNISVAYLKDSGTTTGCTARLYSKASSNRSPKITFTAFGRWKA